VWDAASGALEREIAVGQDLVWSIAFSADGKRLATGSPDEVVVVWDIESGSRFTSLTGHSGGATDVAFLGDGATLIAVDRNGRLHFGDLQTGRRLIEPWPAHHSASWRIAIHPDGERFATAGDDGYVRVWDDLSVERACELSRDAFHGIRRSEYFGNADDVLACTSFVNNSGTNR
jgi:WD40 repeat protein